MSFQGKGDFDSRDLQRHIDDLEGRVIALEDLSKTLLRSNGNSRASKVGLRPETPAGVTVVVQDEGLLLRWDEGLDTDILRYEVEFSTSVLFDTTAEQVYQTVVNYIEIRTPQASDRWYYRLRIRNINQEVGAWYYGEVEGRERHITQEEFYVTEQTGG